MVSNSDRLKSAGMINFARTHKNRRHTTTLLRGVNHQKHSTAKPQPNHRGPTQQHFYNQRSRHEPSLRLRPCRAKLLPGNERCGLEGPKSARFAAVSALALRPVFPWASDVDCELAALEFLAVEHCDRFVRFIGSGKLHECKAARLAGEFVQHQVAGGYNACLREIVAQFPFQRTIGEVPHEQSARIVTHVSNCYFRSKRTEGCCTRRFSEARHQNFKPIYGHLSDRHYRFFGRRNATNAQALVNNLRCGLRSLSATEALDQSEAFLSTGNSVFCTHEAHAIKEDRSTDCVHLRARGCCCWFVRCPGLCAGQVRKILAATRCGATGDRRCFRGAFGQD